MRALLIALLLYIAPVVSWAKSPVVVELFTSEGCSSCPPADHFLTQLADEPGIIALSMHVDYWNSLGWKDPFSDERITRRQREYAAASDSNRVFTPEMRIDGRYSITGSRRVQVLHAIEQAAEERKIPISIKVHNGRPVLANIDAPKDLTGGYHIWQIDFIPEAQSTIKRGENAGRSLKHRNVVTRISRLGRPAPGPHSTDLRPLAQPSEGMAVLLQKAGAGQIVGAAIYQP